MAQSRVERAGSIFSRMTGMIRAGAISWEKRPMWYDIYAAFPPFDVPRRDPPPGPPPPPPTTIFYPEDFIRARFYKEYGASGIINLASERTVSPCQRFVNLYYELAKTDKYSEEELFEKTKELADFLPRRPQSRAVGDPPSAAKIINKLI